MKEIGEYLKNARIQNGVSLDEASEDLNLSVNQLENIEEGNVRAFKDVFSLKDQVRDYAKYLGLELNQVMDEFNDFMFEHTSKISLEDIKEAQALKKQEEKTDKAISPYTKIRTERKIPTKPILIILGVIIVLFIIVSIVLAIATRKENITTELMGSEDSINYECTY